MSIAMMLFCIFVCVYKNNTFRFRNLAQFVLAIINCEMLSHGIDFDGSDMGILFPVHVQNLYSYTEDLIVFKGCKINGFINYQVNGPLWFHKIICDTDYLKVTFNTAGSSKTITDNIAALAFIGYKYPVFKNHLRAYKNTSGVTIARGKAVKKSGFGIALMTSADSASDFVGVAMVEIPNGKAGDVTHSGYLLRPHLLGLATTSVSEGDAIYIDATGSFNKTSGLALLVASDNQNILIK